MVRPVFRAHFSRKIEYLKTEAAEWDTVLRKTRESFIRVKNDKYEELNTKVGRATLKSERSTNSLRIFHTLFMARE